MYDVSKEQSILVHEVPTYAEKILVDNQRIDEQIKEADATLQSRNVNIEAINEHLKLKEELDKNGISIQNVDKLLTYYRSSLNTSLTYYQSI